MNPATTDALVRLMLGGLPAGRTGYPLHCRLRYFDPTRRRAGLPEQVGALVERMTEDEVTVQLVNLDPANERTVIIQGGAYGEHQHHHRAPGASRRVDGGRSFALRGPALAARRGTSRRGYAALYQPADTQPSLGVALIQPIEIPTKPNAGIIDTHVHVWCRGRRQVSPLVELQDPIPINRSPSSG